MWAEKIPFNHLQPEQKQNHFIVQTFGIDGLWTTSITFYEENKKTQTISPHWNGFQTSFLSLKSCMMLENNKKKMKFFSRNF